MFRDLCLRLMLITAIALAGPAGCSNSEDMKKAEAAVEHFHQQLNDAAFDAMYAESDDAMKAQATQEKLVKLLSAVHRKLGNFQSAKSTGWKVFTATGGTTVTLAYASSYEHGQADETFSFHIADGKALLNGYNINSLDMIEN